MNDPYFGPKPTTAHKEFTESVASKFERGAPPQWLARRHHLSASEMQDITGYEPEPDTGRDEQTGY